MRSFITYLQTAITAKNSTFRQKLFHLILLVGLCVSTSMLIFAIIAHSSWISVVLSGLFVLLSFGMLYYLYKTRNFRRVLIAGGCLYYLALFPLAFFLGGGFASGMHLSFLFAIFVTLLLLERKDLLIFLPIELALYSICCLMAYRHPELVLSHTTPLPMYQNAFFTYLSVVILLALVMLYLLRKSEAQQAFISQAQQQAEKASQIKGTFLANLSHEIRTQTHVIVNANELLAVECTTEQMKHCQSQIATSSQMLSDIVNNVLDISELEVGKLRLSEAPYHMADLLTALISVHREQAAQRHLSFAFQLGDTVPTILSGDVTRLKQIVSNLLSNAVKYTLSGTVTLQVSAVFEQPNLVQLYMTVRDTGIGIAPADLPHLFDAFHRGATLPQPNTKGSGLGLAIAKNLTDFMAGRLLVDSTPNVGSTFTLELPQIVIDPSPLAVSDAWLAMPRHSSGFLCPTGKVLLVDDNAESIRILQELLQYTLLTVHVAANGSQALARLRQETYHVILMDYTMPTLSGAQTLQAMQAENLLHDTPVIAFTAHSIKQYKQEFLEKGFCDVLQKPISHGELEQALLTHLPPKLVNIIHAPAAKDTISQGGYAFLEQGLARYDITLGEGMRFCGNNLLHYKKRAEILLENFSKKIADATRLLQAEDYHSFSFVIHSLKPSAHALGALDLYQHATHMEQRCGHALDRAYLQSAMPLLLLQWTRVYDGLCWLMPYLRTLYPAAETPISTGSNLPQQVEQAYAAICSNQWKQSKAALSALQDCVSEETDADHLAKVYALVDSLQFDEAEALLQQRYPRKESSNV